MMTRERQRGSGEPCYGQRRMEGIPPYPPTIWALVEQAAEQWSDHVRARRRPRTFADRTPAARRGRRHRRRPRAHGITAGTIVSWQLPTTLETMVVMTALARLGAIQNPLIPILREREVGFITNQVGTEVFITTERWRGFEHGELARSLAAEQGFTVVLTDLDTDPATIGNTLRLPRGRCDDAPGRAVARRRTHAVDLHVVGHHRRSQGRAPHRPLGDARRHRPDRHRLRRPTTSTPSPSPCRTSAGCSCSLPR